ncbi:MAG: hypothetical protein O3A20_04720 [Planctomycetota bacterium]|nr:hypothetical protein [Planctomycetota bacterium]
MLPSLTSRSPIAVYFGALDCRILQLAEGRRSLSVAAHEVVEATGKLRQTAVAESLAPRLKSLGFRGRDCAIGLSNQEVAMTLIPIDAQSRPRCAAILQETAARAVQDDEGVEYRCLAAAGADSAREEYLVFTVGTSDKRRSQNAIEALKWRPVSMEAAPFALVRALAPANANPDEVWGVLHIGFTHSLFAIVEGTEIRFLKQMHLTGERLLATLHRSLQDQSTSSQDAAQLARMLNAGSAEATAESHIGPSVLPDVQRLAVGRAQSVLDALKLETEAFAGEVRACIRHFGNRHGGVRFETLRLSGFGAALPEMESVISSTLAVDARIARPFTERGIRAPEAILAEEHLWTIPLGLALRSSNA